MRSTRSLWLGWGLMALVLVTALFVGTRDGNGPHTNQERVLNIADTIKCPECVGQSVAESDVAISREIRAQIARGVDAGQSDDDIRAQIASSYGDDILLTPSASGVAGLVWVLPVVAAVAAIAGLAFAFARWRGKGPVEATDDDRRLVDAALVQQHRGGSGADQTDDDRSGGAV